MTKPTLFCGLSAGLPAATHFRSKPHPVFPSASSVILLFNSLYNHTQNIDSSAFVFLNCALILVNFSENPFVWKTFVSCSMSLVHFCWLFFTCLVLLEVFTFMLVVCSFVCPLTRQPPRCDRATSRLIVIVAQIETRAHKIQFPSS